jgi:hypothetical protein
MTDEKRIMVPTAATPTAPRNAKLHFSNRRFRPYKLKTKICRFDPFPDLVAFNNWRKS